jgi:uncharacterized protein YjiK
MKSFAFRLVLLIVGVSSSLYAPAQDGQATTDSTSQFTWAYDFDEPEAVFELENELDEISGLSIVPGRNLLAAVQDEEGDIYLLDKNTGKLLEQHDFWKDGDYEGVEVVNDCYFAVKSSGTLYEVQHIGKENQKTEKYNEFLNDDYDVEGLAYDPKHQRLLLACKAKSGDGPQFDFKKAIYAFDLATKKLLEEPALLISIEDIQDYLDTSPTIRKLEKIVEFFSPNQSKFVFSPSAIAVHPQTGHWYILSTAGNTLVVLDPDGSILHIEKLKKKMHPQAEGICFDTDGTLFIANEADGGTARIYKYGQKK